MTEKAQQKLTKKAQILARHERGERDIEVIAREVDTTTSYVASVLQAEQGDALPGYFDLYTSTGRAMNVYARDFQGKMRFRDERAARRSVKVLEEAYARFEREQDRAGQHHALALALMMMNRARFSGKRAEARIFGLWMMGKLRHFCQPPQAENDDHELRLFGELTEEQAAALLIP